MAPLPRSAAALPIDEILPSLREALNAGRAAVVEAPPGAGKTTRIPLALLGAPWLGDQRMIMLEPRRLAARAAARRMALTLDEDVGGTVGFRVRGETRVSARTRIEVVTEGVLTRMLQSDPSLDGIGLLLFDEYHERHVQSDLGLALALQAQEVLRPDLRLLVMSATLDGAAVAGLLGNAVRLTSAGRMHPVEVRYLGRRDGQRTEAAVAAAVRNALARDEGSVLAFLPGVAEIRRTAALLDDGVLPRGVRVHALYGDLSSATQDMAIAPTPEGERKVVLATAIAETSLTIEGVRIVVDGGLARVPRFSPRSGMMRLDTVRVSRAASEQRCGRAGRTAPGTCYRLWSEAEQAGLLARAGPEILEADLAALVLDLAVAGVRNVAELRWLDAPPAGAVGHARALLRQLDAVDAADRVTPHGREMAAFGVHPRLAHMLLRARARGLGATACFVAALLEERDVVRRETVHRDPDLRLRVALVAGDGRSEHHDIDGEAMRRVREQARAWRAQLRVPRDEGVDEEAAGRLVALAYPDRVAQRRSGSAERFLMRSGLGGVLDDAGSLARSPFLAIADLDGRVPEARIYLAAPLEREAIDELFEGQVVSEDVIDWDAAAGTIRARRVERLGAIVLRDSALRAPDDEAVARVLGAAVAAGDGVAVRWAGAAQALRERLVFLHAHDAGWPDVSDSALAESVEQWLTPRLLGLRTRAEVERLDPGALLLDLLTREQRRALDVLAPTHVAVPTGSRIAIDYADPASPVLAVRLQELFGLPDTPRIAAGTVPLTLHLLSPAHRPVQVTRDLAGFWRSSYFAVRKDLRGRYPKHEWPEDPLSATPTRRAKPRAR